MKGQPRSPIFRDARRDEVPAIVSLLADDSLGRTREAWSEAVDPAYLLAFDAIDRDGANRLIVASWTARWSAACSSPSFRI